MAAQLKQIAVVGAGVVGLCTALEVQRQGFEVTLFDRDEPGRGASFGNAGYLATELVAPLATPETVKSAIPMWLDRNGPLSLPLRYLHRSLPWLLRFCRAALPSQVAQGQAALSQLNQQSVAAWQRSLSDIDATEMLVQSGYLLVWESSARLKDAQQHADWLAEQGIETELVQGARLAELEPELAPKLSHALYFPHAWRVSDPFQLCQRLAAAFQAQGGVIRQQTVASILPAGQGVQLRCADAEYDFDRAIICAGAWSRQFLPDLPVPLEGERGYHLTWPTDAVQLNHPIGSAERRMVMSPLDSGVRVVGMTEFGGLSLAPLKRSYAALRHHAQQLFPALQNVSQLEQPWMGHRPTLPDSLPVIDRHPVHPQLLFAFGNQHLGLTQAAITAELVVQLMLEHSAAVDITPFRVDRF